MYIIINSILQRVIRSSYGVRLDFSNIWSSGYRSGHARIIDSLKGHGHDFVKKLFFRF